MTAFKINGWSPKTREVRTDKAEGEKWVFFRLQGWRLNLVRRITLLYRFRVTEWLNFIFGKKSEIMFSMDFRDF